MTFEEWIRSEGLSNGEVAERIGCKPPTISRLRNGKLWPSKKTAGRIYKASGGRVTFGGLTEEESK